MAELKSCPFCGREAILDHSEGGSEGRVWMLARCSNIECQGHYFNRWLTTIDEAIEAWNTRYEPVCHWEYKHREEVYETTCGHAFMWEPHGVPDYCPGCGGRVKVVD